MKVSDDPCPACGGGEKAKGCTECRGWGRPHIFECPQLTIPGEAWEHLRAANLAIDHGLMPVAGGWLEQTDLVVEAMQRVAAQRRSIEAERASAE